MNKSRLSNLTRHVRCYTCVTWIVSLLLLSALPAPVEAQFNYIITGGTVTITGYTGPGGAVTIPSTIAGLPVTGIGNNAFRNCLNLTSVTIPNSVTSIGNEAFADCGLTNVTIGTNVTSIGAQAFSGCGGLTSVTIPPSVTNIGEEAFADCTSLLAITVDALNFCYSSVDGVLFNKGQTTLMQCPAGKTGSYTVPSSVTGIGNGAFYYCRSLTTVTIPNTVTSFGDYAFYHCDLLVSATIPTSVTSIGPAAFENCGSLTSITIPDSVTTIADGTFYCCCSLTRVTIPNTVTSVGYYAFYWCFSLTNVTIGDRVMNIGAGAFRQCTDLTSVTIPSSVTNIGDWAFESCTRLTAVAIPNSVTSVGGFAFEGCTSLTSVTIGDSVTNIGLAAFSSCTSLTNVAIGNRVIIIGVEAFKYCYRLASVYFHGNAPSVGSSVFLGDAATVYYLPGTTGWGATLGGRPTAPWPPPAIQAPPQTQTAETGSIIEFRVQAVTVGDLPLGYQWSFNGTTRLSCTNSILQLPSVQPPQAGAYTVIVTNAAGSVTSPPALLSVIAPVERRMVPALTLMGQPGTTLNLGFTAALGPTPLWTTFDNVTLTAASQWYFDLSSPTPSQRFYRAWQSGGGAPSALRLNLVPALTLTGAIGSSQRVDYINQFGPIDAWVTNLATVTLTNTAQFYFDTSVIGQPSRLYRIVPVP